jgi:hypothetical protein
VSSLGAGSFSISPQARKPDATFWLIARLFSTEQNAAGRSGSDGTADKAVEPMVIRLLRSDFPLIHGAASSLSSHAILRRQMFSEKSMLFRERLKQRQTPRIPLRDN